MQRKQSGYVNISIAIQILKSVSSMDNHRKTTSQFVKEAQKVHGDKYDYSEVEYVNTHTPIRIKCKQCSVVFLQSPANHLVGRGCPRCSKKQTHKRVNQEMFIARARAVHGDKYDYSKTDYQDMRSKVLIVCPVHGEFWQRAQSHLLGNGCPACKRDNHIRRIAELQKSILEQQDGDESRDK